MKRIVIRFLTDGGKELPPIAVSRSTDIFTELDTALKWDDENTDLRSATLGVICTSHLETWSLRSALDEAQSLSFSCWDELYSDVTTGSEMFAIMDNLGAHEGNGVKVKWYEDNGQADIVLHDLFAGIVSSVKPRMDSGEFSVEFECLGIPHLLSCPGYISEESPQDVKYFTEKAYLNYLAEKCFDVVGDRREWNEEKYAKAKFKAINLKYVKKGIAVTNPSAVRAIETAYGERYKVSVVETGGYSYEQLAYRASAVAHAVLERNVKQGMGLDGYFIHKSEELFVDTDPYFLAKEPVDQAAGESDYAFLVKLAHEQNMVFFIHAKYAFFIYPDCRIPPVTVIWCRVPPGNTLEEEEQKYASVVVASSVSATRVEADVSAYQVSLVSNNGVAETFMSEVRASSANLQGKPNVK